MGSQISFDDHPELFSLIEHKRAKGHNKSSLRSLVQDSEKYVQMYIALLPPVDRTVAHLYFIESLSQDQISELIGVTQAAVSRRLKFIRSRIKLLMRMPTLSPIQVREDFRFLFPPELFEFAYFFYFEYAQNRVKHFINTSQSGAANKLDRVIGYLKDIMAPAMQWDGSLGALDGKQYVAKAYLDYFEYTRHKANIITFLFKGNDERRAGSIVKGPARF